MHSPEQSGSQLPGSSVVPGRSSVVPWLPAARQNKLDDIPTIIGPAPSGNFGLHLESGETLAHFEIIGPLGMGGMASVYKAKDRTLSREVALKILPPELAREPDNVARFKNEARSSAKLNHENIARVFYSGEERGLNFIAFEYVEGDTLREMIDSLGSVPHEEGLRYLADIALGLQHAAERGVVHRDVKPSNIVVTPDGRAKLIDMGLARSMEPHSVHGGVTQSGMTLGTFDYISPEQAIDPRAADVRSDIYSLGCTFYHAFSGQIPVPEGNAARKLHAHQSEQPLDPRLHNPLIPEEVVQILAKMMAKKPDKRYATANELLEAVRGTAALLKVPMNSSVEAIPIVALSKPEFALRSPMTVLIPLLVAGALLFLGTLGFGFIAQEMAKLPPPPSSKPRKSDSNEIPVVEPGPNVSVKTNPAKPEKIVSNLDELQAVIDDGATKITFAAGAFIDLTAHEGYSFTARNIDWETAPDGKPATIRLHAIALKVDRLGDVRRGSLTFQKCESVRLHGLRLEIVPPVGEKMEQAVGLLALDVGRIELGECRIEMESPFELPDGCAVEVRPTTGNTTQLNAKHLFTSVKNGTTVRLVGAVNVSIQESGLIAQRPIFDCGSVGESSDTQSIVLRQCTVQIGPNGGLIQALPGQGSMANVSAGYCLFSASTSTDGGMGTGEMDRKPPLIKNSDTSDISMVSLESLPNAVYRVETPANLQATVLKAAPWTPNPRPEADRPWYGLELNTKQSSLRVSSTSVAILGVRHLPNPQASIYPEWPLPSLAPSNIKVWYPNATDAEKAELPPHVYPDLAQAVAAIKGKGTVLVRGSGPVTIPRAVILSDPKCGITIKPEEGSNPLLTLGKDANLKEVALFRLEAGTLTLEKIRVRIRSRAQGDVVSLVELGSGVKAELKACLVTLDSDGDGVAAVATIRDTAAQMKKDLNQRPTLLLESCLVRGAGQLARVPVATPAEIICQQCGVALSQPVFDIGPSNRPHLPGSAIKLTMTHNTVSMNSALIDLHPQLGTADDNKANLLPLDVSADANLLISWESSDEPLVRHRGKPSHLDRELTWETNTGNAYAYYTTYLVTGESKDDLTRWSRKDWRDWSKENPSAFATVKLPKEINIRNVLTVKPSDLLTTILPDRFADYGWTNASLPKEGDD